MHTVQVDSELEINKLKSKLDQANKEKESQQYEYSNEMKGLKTQIDQLKAKLSQKETDAKNLQSQVQTEKDREVALKKEEVQI